MKKLLLYISIFLSLTSITATAQNFTMEADTVRENYNGAIGSMFTLHNNITNTTSSSISVTWRVTANNFPSGWKGPGVLGICDAVMCRDDIDFKVSDGLSYTAPYPANETNDFHIQLTPQTEVPNGTYYMTVRLTSGSQTKDVVFVINKQSTSISNINKDINVNVFPNPARGGNINVTFNGVNNVKNIALFNLIGKAVNSYRVNGNAAVINIEDIPSGLYFVRLLDGQGRIIATRKFTKQ